MDWIHKFINIILPPIILILLLFILPPYYFFKFLCFIKTLIFNEKVAGKVVLITGASSGIGEHLAYEYARRGARLALVARREDLLLAVADKAQQLGSPDVIVINADVSKVEDCKRFIDEALNHFGQLDHLVSNAGVLKLSLFEDANKISDYTPIMDINFWGAVYVTHFAIPHLKKSKGKIVVIASSSGILHLPRMSIYNASKAALIGLYETLRTEFGSDIGITIANPGLIESEMTQNDFGSKTGLDIVPVESTQGCAKAIVTGACRGRRYLTEPSWVRLGYLLKVLCPEVLEWCSRLLLITARSRPGPETSTQE